MPDKNKALKAVYSALQGNNVTNLGTEEEFAARMEKPGNRKKVYDLMSGMGFSNLGTYEEFDSRFATQKAAEPQQATAQQEQVETMPEGVTTENTTNQPEPAYSGVQLPVEGIYQPKQEAKRSNFVEITPEEQAQVQAEAQQEAVKTQTQKDVEKYGTGNEAYSFEDAVAAGQEYEAMAPEIEGFDKKLNDFNAKWKPFEEKIAQMNAGKLSVSPEEYSKMQEDFKTYESESSALAETSKRYDTLMQTAPGQEYKAISEKMKALSTGPRSAENVLEYSNEFAKLQRNPIYRATLGENAPSEDEIESGRLQGEIAYIEEKLKTAKGDEKKALKQQFSDAKEALYSNPYYQKYIQGEIEKNKGENERIGVMRAELVQRLREGYKAKGIDPQYYWQMEKGEPELQLLDAAAHMRDDAIREYKAPTKYGDSSGARNAVAGLKDWASNADTYSFGLGSFTENIAVVRPILEKVESLVGNIDPEMLTDGSIAELEKQLSPAEMEVLDAYFEKVGAKSVKGADTSIGYQIGQGIGDMISLGIEMAMTGGTGGVVHKAVDKAGKTALMKLLGKRAYRKVAKNGVGRIALWGTQKVASDIAETSVRIPFMPSTYKNLGESAVTAEQDLGGKAHLKNPVEYTTDAIRDTFIEDLTEVSNGFAFPMVAKIAKMPGMTNFLTKMVGGEDTMKVLSSFIERGDVQMFHDMMIGSFGGEWEEELLGAVIHQVIDDPNALKDFFSAEQQLVLLGTLAPIPLARGTVGGVSLASTSARASYSWNKAEAELKRLGFDEGRIARIKEVVDNASVSEGSHELINAMREAGVSRQAAETHNFIRSEMSPENDVLHATISGVDPEAYNALAHYFWAAQQKRAVGLMGEIQEDKKVRDKMAEMKMNLGQFYHQYNGEDVVEVATKVGPSGTLIPIFITSEEPGENGEMAYVSQDGAERGFVKRKDILNGESSVTPINRYLGNLVLQDTKVEEAQEVVDDINTANATLREQVEALPEVSYNGTTGVIRNATDEGATFVPDDASQEAVVVPWAELAASNGIAEPEVIAPAEKQLGAVDATMVRKQAQSEIAAAFHAGMADADMVTIPTDGGEAVVVNIIEDTIKPEEGTAQFVVTLPDGTKTVTMATSIQSVTSQFHPAEQPIPAPDNEAQASEGEKPAIPVDKKTRKKVYDSPEVTPEVAYEDIYKGAEPGSIDEENADTWVTRKSDAANKALSDAKAEIAKADEEKAAIDGWKIKADEDLDDLRARKEAAKKKIDEQIAKAKESIPELERKAEFWNTLRIVADTHAADRRRKANAEKLDLEPKSLEEAISYALTGFFNGGGRLNYQDVIDVTGIDPASLRKQGWNFVFSKDGISIDNFVHNVLSGDSLAGVFVKDEQEAINLVGNLLREKTRAQLGSLIEDNRKAEKEAEEAYVEGAALFEQQQRKAAMEQKQEAPVKSEGSEPAQEPEQKEPTVEEKVEKAREEVDTNPTDAQKEAGNFKKGHVTIDGLDISIENPKGSARKGKDANGNEWSVTMNNDYGYIRGTKTLDGDQIDVFLSDTPSEGKVYVIDQKKVNYIPSYEIPDSVVSEVWGRTQNGDLKGHYSKESADLYNALYEALPTSHQPSERQSSIDKLAETAKLHKGHPVADAILGSVKETQVGHGYGFDEHKVMYGFHSMEEAKQAYLSNYSDGWPGLGAITEVTKDEFRKWLDSSDRKTKPFADYKSVQAEAAQNEGQPEPEPQPETEAPAEEPKTPVTKTVVQQHPENLRKAYESGDAEQIAAAEKALADFINSSDSVMLLRGTENAAKRRRKEAKNDSAEYKLQDFIAQTIKKRLAKMDKAVVKAYDDARKTYEDRFNASKEDLEAAIKYYESERETAQSLLDNAPEGSEETYIIGLKNRIGTANRHLNNLNVEMRRFEEDEVEHVEEEETEEAPVEEPAKTEEEALTKEAAAAPQAEISQAQEKYEDFGEKIGMARKDTATKGGKKGNADSRPSWLKKYETMNVRPVNEEQKRMLEGLGIKTDFEEEMDIINGVDYTKPFVAFYEEKKKGRWGSTRKRYITGADYRPIIFTSKEQYEATVPVFEAKMQGYRVSQRNDGAYIVRPASNGKLVEYAKFNTKEDAVAYLSTPEGCTELLNRKRENFELPALETLTRNGMKDYRQGKNVTPDDILNTFGFRGGEFGNWLNADERQQFLNYAYDALMDMAEMIGVSPKALSLNGELSIAFGARGKGGEHAAAAHYEPDRAVINLTKMNGAGTLAHEWAHALDNYFGLMDAKVERERKEGADNRHYLSEEHHFVSGARKEMIDAFKDVINTLTRKQVTREIAVEKAQEDYDKAELVAKKALENERSYFAQGRSHYAYNRKTKQRESVTTLPTEEQLKEFDQLADALMHDKNLGYEWDWKSQQWRGTGENAEKMYTLVSAIFPKGYTARYNLEGVFSKLDKLNRSAERLEKAKAGETETITVETDMMRDSKWFDKDRAGEYWTRIREMFARGFEEYLAYKMGLEDKSSDYLTYRKGTLYQQIWEHSPYPLGDELIAARDAYDRFFNTIQEKEGENGKTILYGLRTQKSPEKTQKVYKLMRLGDDGKLYPLFIDSASPIELGRWYDADSPDMGFLKALPSGTYLVNPSDGTYTSLEDYQKQHDQKAAKYPSVEAVNEASRNGMRWVKITDTEKGQRRYEGETRKYENIGINGSGSVSTFAMRPGWHAGSLPTMRQIGKGAGKNLRDDRFVWVEGEVSADVDYNKEAQSNPDNDIPTHIPTDGYYMKATNANKKVSQADRVGWYVAGAFKPERIISDAEARSIIDEWNEAHPNETPVEYDWEREGGVEFVPEGQYAPTVPYVNANEYQSKLDDVRSKLSVAKRGTEEYNSLKEQEKKVFADYFDKIDPNHIGIDYEDIENAEEYYKSIGYSEKDAKESARFMKRLGAYGAYSSIAQRIVFFVENIKTIDDGRGFYVHENQHYLTEKSGLDVEYAAKLGNNPFAITEELSKTVGEVAAREYAIEYANDPVKLANEVISYCMQYVYDYPGFVKVLENLHLAKETIEFVKTLANEQSEASVRPAIQGYRYGVQSNVGGAVRGEQARGRKPGEVSGRGGSNEGSRRNQGPQFGVAPYSKNDIFFSNAERAAESIKNDKATPQQWLAMLEKNGGLKAGEDKWLGLSDWLKSQDKKTLTKQEVLDYIRQNKIQVEETHYSENGDDLAIEKAHPGFYRAYYLDENGFTGEPTFGGINDLDAAIQLYNNEHEDKIVVDDSEETRINNPGEKISEEDWDKLLDYGESLVKDGDASFGMINRTRIDYTTEGLKNKREIALTVPTIEPWKRDDTVHFGDAGEGRAIAWARFGETNTAAEGGYSSRAIMDELEKKYGNPRAYDKMTDEDAAKAYFADYVYRGQKGDYNDYKSWFMDGEIGRSRANNVFPIFKKMVEDNNASGGKVLVIDEIQSKRHQTAREKDALGNEIGYKDKELEEKANRHNELSRKSYSDEGLTFEEHKEFRQLQEELYNVGSYNIERNRKAVPAAPFEKNWHELAMKRMLRLAAEEGYDYVAWTTGDQQAERYDMGKVVDDIEKSDGKIYIDLKDGSAITLTTDSSGVITSSTGAHIESGAYNGKNLSEIIGKELATKVLSTKGNQVFRGFDLRVGGEGMKGFYDEILPRFMNKYGKKWGVQVEDITLPNLEKAGSTMHAVRITPEMKESVMQGQPMFRRGEAETENLKEPLARAKAISELNSLAEKLGIKFKEDGALRGKGVFDPKTGQIRINIDAHDSASDLQATLLHEAVAHYGLRRLLGKEFTDTMRSLYDKSAQPIKEAIDAIAQKEGLSREVATEEYLASLAEDGRFTPEEESFWQQVCDWLRDFLRNLGLRTELTDADMRALLYASYRNLQTSGAIEKARTFTVYNALREQAELSRKEDEDNGPDDGGPSGGVPIPGEDSVLSEEGINALPEDVKREAIRNQNEELYRKSRNQATALTAADMYGQKVRSMGSAVKEVLVDEYAPVDALTNALAEESKKPLGDHERVSDQLRESGGKAMNAIRQYDKKYLRPMWDAVSSFREKADATLEETETYLGLKSGLERNVVFAKRDAKNTAKIVHEREYAERVAELNEKERSERERLKFALDNGLISDVTYQGEMDALDITMRQLRDKAKADYNAKIANVDAETDSEYKKIFAKKREKDYSALTAWAGTNKLEDAEQAAQDYVNDMEARAGKDATDELWKRVNAATKETLKFQYEHDMITRDQYRDVSSMMEYYVPMRGFADKTAEDLFNYYVTPQNSAFQPTLQTAKGRKTWYEGPLGNIGAMHSSAISQGVKNEAKLSLLNAVRNRKDNSIATVTRAWFVDSGQVDEEGKPIFEVAYPQIPEGADFATRQSIIEQFDQDMKAKREKGEAYNAAREVDLHGGVVAFEKEPHKSEHIVKVREGGRDYGIIINGNPAAAQAINGVKRGNGAGEKILDVMRTWTRFLSQMFTTLSVPFWVSNFQRDHGQGLTNVFIRNNKDYLGRYIANRYKAFKVFPMIIGNNTLDNRLAKNDPVAKLYAEYLENGGPMGQNRIEDNEYFERQMKRYLDNSSKGGIVGGAKSVLDFIGGVGEAVETITRFAVYMTSREAGRSVHESISDAKEVSTNFARKGSGRSFTKSELDHMTHADGSPLSQTERNFLSALSIGVEICRASIPFFNAAVQGLENKVTNYRNNWQKTLLADSIYFMLGFGMQMLLGNAGGDDDKEKYSHTSDYLRRNNILGPLSWMGLDGVYSKWALPQEYRVMYAMGDIVAGAMKKERPMEDVAADTFGALMQLSPIGAVSEEVVFSEGDKKKAAENLLLGVMPGVISPVIEAVFNRDFKGARLYNEGFNNNLRAYPGWTKALPTTGKEYVEAAKFLNNITGGNDVERGIIDMNPAIVEHLIESYFSGPYQIVVRGPEAVAKAARGEAGIRDIPLVNRMLLNTNDNQRDAYYSNMYYFFKEKDTEAERIFSEYKNRGGEELEDFMSKKDYEYMLVFKQYDSLEKAIRKQGKQAEKEGDEDGKKKADEEIQAIHEEIAKRCLDIYFGREEVK